MRLSSGVRGFEQLTDGGLLADRLYILSGPPGSGKTTFSAQFVTQGAREGQRCLYMSMHETEQELVNDMANFDFGFEAAVNSDLIGFLNLLDSDTRRMLAPPGEADFQSGVKNMTKRINNMVTAQGIERLVIDSTMLLEYFFPDESRAFIQFLTSLKQADTTTLLISEMTDPTSYSEVHYLAHGVVFLHNYLESSGMTRGVQIVKMRGTAIDCDIRKLSFSDDGLCVHPNQYIE